MSNNAHGTGLDWTNPAPAGLVALAVACGLLSIVILCLDVALPLITIKNLGLLAAGSAASHAVPAVIGWALLLAGTVALYIASAIIVNRTFGKVVFKLPGPMLKGK